MQATEIRTRTEFRFTGHNEVVYGRGLTLVEAVRDAEGHIGETMFTQEAIDENGYIVEVEQRQDPDNGEWIDMK
ncbi:hypothetical protein [Burkholderia plantarii]|uniref:hypothetical protein n=1 Tax=Burkholderia plantarii TaxID=41899 RepID=UPI0018DCA684|nr:hypothetical protein [Burkholderia plantarii]MBI0326945.1 hypothetical protein [Burkholderia plantarii]